MWCATCRVESIEGFVSHGPTSRSISSTLVAAAGVAFDVCEFTVGDRELVVAAGIEVLELVDAIEDVADEFLEEHPGSHADFASQIAGDRVGEHIDVRVVAPLGDRASVASAPSAIDVADPAAHLAQAVEVEAAKAKLNSPRVVETSVGGEISVEPLGKRRETRDSLRTVEEGWRARDYEVEAGVATLIDLIDQLPKRVQCSVADIGANTLQCLDLVKHEHESRVTCAPKDRQQSTKEGEGSVVVEVPADSSRPA